MHTIFRSVVLFCLLTVQANAQYGERNEYQAARDEYRAAYDALSACLYSTGFGNTGALEEPDKVRELVLSWCRPQINRLDAHVVRFRNIDKERFGSNWVVNIFMFHYTHEHELRKRKQWEGAIIMREQ
jgi:hypothetical protein